MKFKISFLLNLPKTPDDKLPKGEKDQMFQILMVHEHFHMRIQKLGWYATHKHWIE